MGARARTPETSEKTPHTTTTGIGTTSRRRRTRGPRPGPGSGPVPVTGTGFGPAGRGGLRRELDWEVLEVAGGPNYVARRVPTAELLLPAADESQIGVGAVLVLDTHDLALAATTAWPVWSRQWPGRRLPVPARGWWRCLPVDPARTGGAGAGADHLWWPARPGTPGAVPAVEWPLPGGEPGRDDLSGGGR